MLLSALSACRRRLDNGPCASIPNTKRVVGHRLSVIRGSAVFRGHDVVEQLLRSGHFRLREGAMRHSLTPSSVCDDATMAEGAALSRRGLGSAA